MKKIIVLVGVLLCAISLHAKGDLHLFSIENKDNKIIPYTFEKAFNEAGLHVELSSNMIGPFKKKFKETKYQTFTLMTMWSKKYSKKLVNKYAQAGVFTPMGVGIYQEKGSNILHLSILTAEAQAKILGVKDLVLLKKIEQEVLGAITENFPTAKHTFSEESLKSTHSLVSLYELELEDDDDWKEIQDEFLMGLKEEFKPYGFVVPQHMNVNDMLTNSGKTKSPYDFYMSYSICKLPVIYTVSKTRPEASAFAPCTTMVYKKKDENKIVVGFPGVYNWLSSAHVTDTESKKILLKAQTSFESILKSLVEE